MMLCVLFQYIECKFILALSLATSIYSAINPIQTQSVVVLPDGRMDRKNAARYTGLSVKTLAMHACKGTGPRSIKRGRVFYFKEDLDEWIKSG
tara:strand:+ start:9380 stop:9658 length:279 start_codon:yes stop_codon:yes gene_type:complete